MANKESYSGIWYCCYWFPSNTHGGEDRSEYYVEVIQRGNKLTLQSLPTENGAYMLVKLVVENGLATGTWEETTSAQGEFKGAIYSGAVQLLVSKDGMRMDGGWVGVGRDHSQDRARIYTGKWELSRAGSRQPTKEERSTLVVK